MPDWKQVLAEIANATNQAHAVAQNASDIIRRGYLGALAAHTGRNTIAYYSGWLAKQNIGGLEISDEDKNGFMMAVHGLDRSKGLDLILHTPGGGIAATQSLVDYLHKMFGNDMRAIVPQIAMSAGTMLVCSCKSVLMAKHSNLGPIDPHLNGIPAYGVIEEFKRAVKEVKAKPESAALWQPIIAQYRPAFLGQCAHAIKWSNAFVLQQLETVMFANDPAAKKKARKVVRRLTDYSGNKTHSLHLHAEDCQKAGIVVEQLEANATLQDLVLTVHHCYMHALTNGPAFKIIENQNGAAWVKALAPRAS
jgi:ATP-dependent protease ClpP protease subunit